MLTKIANQSISYLESSTFFCATFFWKRWNMKINSPLLTSSVLSTLKLGKGVKSLNLMVPFVEHIISEKDEEICNLYFIQMELYNQFGFKNFPLFLLRKILNSLCKENKIKLENEEYWFIAKDKSNIIKFQDELKTAKKDNETIINNLTKYLSSKIGKKINSSIVEGAFSDFLVAVGFDILENPFKINYLQYDFDKEQLNYLIGRYILEQYENNKCVFNMIERIISGMFVASAIYIETNDLKEVIKNVDFYFDSPFLLGVLGYKSEFENKEANELINILKSKQAKLKCFRNNFKELENILQNYIEKYMENSNPYIEKTLEGLNSNFYTVDDVKLLIYNLEENLLLKGIELVETPEYIKERHKFVIKEEELFENLKNDFISEYPNDRAIRNDVKSVASIALLRDKKRVKFLENSKALFITNNKQLVKTVNRTLEMNTDYEIGYTMTACNLTAIVWFSNVEKNEKLVTLRLSEYARASTKLTKAMTTECVKQINKLVNEGYSDENFINLMRSQAFTDELSLAIEGDIKKINDATIVKVYEKASEESKRKDVTLGIFQEGINLAKKEMSEQKKMIEEYEQQAKNREQNINRNIEKEVQKKLRRSNFIKIVIFIILLYIVDSLIIMLFNKYIQLNSLLSILLGGVPIIPFNLVIYEKIFNLIYKKSINKSEMLLRTKIREEVMKFSG